MSGTATFSVAATGATGFEWFFASNSLSDGGGITGATTNMLTLANVVQADAGNYFVSVSDSDGDSIDSNPATLTVECKLQSCPPDVQLLLCMW